MKEITITFPGGGRVITAGDVKTGLVRYLENFYHGQTRGMNNFALLTAERLLDEEEATITDRGIELLESIADRALQYNPENLSYGISYVQLAVLIAIETGLWYRRSGYTGGENYVLPVSFNETVGE